ncbi:hypothetical protein IV203_019722 [Nitzschia inconspicua]|uniref:Uncharacterized protein n=1 Tax=Nitzschia inconspicua TaxID=303405 RepID=A0A9K3LZQ4_9STRA|nr:hypothetical protein IV203_019722 [Nitzschia inconspicua]
MMAPLLTEDIFKAIAQYALDINAKVTLINQWLAICADIGIVVVGNMFLSALFVSWFRVMTHDESTSQLWQMREYYSLMAYNPVALFLVDALEDIYFLIGFDDHLQYVLKQNGNGDMGPRRCLWVYGTTNDRNNFLKFFMVLFIKIGYCLLFPLLPSLDWWVFSLVMVSTVTFIANIRNSYYRIYRELIERSAPEIESQV